MRNDISIDEKTRAIQCGVLEVLREHALLGRSISAWRDGAVVRLSSPEILEELRRSELESQDPTTNDR